MESHFIGEAAAISVSLLWTSCSLLFAFAGKRVGVLSVNALRIVMAVGLLCIAHIVVLGTLIPSANGSQWLYMGLSGVIGLSIGDFCYFGSLVMLGPRRGVLLMATNPIFATVTAMFLLNEVPNWVKLLGIGVTVAGVLWVIMESEEKSREKAIDRKAKTYGVLLGIGGSVGQGVGLVLSKYGMNNAASDQASPLNPLTATLMRMVVAAVFFWAVILLMRKAPEVFRAFGDRKAVGSMFSGAIFGPFLGVWLSMVAITYTLTGVAATLMSLMPLTIIPIMWGLYGQRTSWRGFLGAVIAIAGIALLFLA